MFVGDQLVKLWHKIGGKVRAVRTFAPKRLTARTCIPCKGIKAPLREEEMAHLYAELKGGWKIVEAHHLEKEYIFPDFRTALIFTNEVGEIAESEGHHPDIFLSFGKVKIQLWTHRIQGLSENDFIMAAKCDELYLLQ